MGSICIYNGTIVTMDTQQKIIENGVILVEDSIIKAIGDESLLEKYSYDEKIDAKNGGYVKQVLLWYHLLKNESR